MAQSSRYQGTQDVIGTVAYMSPEQIQGKPRPASDQYSLAVVVYEWLTGDRPFRGSFTEMCTQHMFAPPPPIRERLPQISPAIEQVIMKALDKDPKQRFESIKGFADALAQTGQGQSYQTEQIPPAASNTSYSTNFMPTGMGQPSQTPSQLGVNPLPANPYTMLQSQPYGSATNDPRNTGLNSNPVTNPMQTGPNTTGPKGMNTANPTAHSSPTIAQTGLDPRNMPPQQPPMPGGQFGPQKMMQPGAFNQSGQSGLNNPQQRPPVGPPNNYQQAGAPPYNPQNNPNMQRPPNQYPPQQNPGYNNLQRPPNQGPNDYQQNMGRPPGAQPPYPGAGPQNGPNQYPPQQQAPTHYDENDEEDDYPARRAPAQQPRQHEPQESMASWLGPLGSYKLPIIGTFVGIILFCAFHDFRPEMYGRQIPIVLVLPLFFGGAFGLIPGVIVGLVGDMFARLLYGQGDPITATLFPNSSFNGYHAWWFPLAFYGVAGLATGLAMLGRRKFPSIGSSIRSTILAIIIFAVIIGLVLFNTKEVSLFTSIGLIILANIAISFIMLIIYSIIGRLIIAD